MIPPVSRLLRWAVVLAVGIAVTLALWQDPVLAYAPGGGPATALPVPLVGLALALAGVAGPTAGRTVALVLGPMLAARRRRPVSVARPRGAPRPLSASRPPNRRRSRR